MFRVPAIAALSAIMLLAATTPALAAVLIVETFDGYTTGPLNNQGDWTQHSGIADQVEVTDVSAVSGMASNGVMLSENETEDLSRPLGQSISSGSVYATLTVNFMSVPTYSGGGGFSYGNYFAHLKDENTGYVCRLFARTNPATGGIQIGCTTDGKDIEGATPAAVVETSPGSGVRWEGTTGMTYVIVMKLSFPAAPTERIVQCWVDPDLTMAESAQTGPTSQAFQAPVNPSGIPAMTRFSFRQSNSVNGVSGVQGMGELLVDNVVVATMWSELDLSSAIVVVSANNPVDPIAAPTSTATTMAEWLVENTSTTQAYSLDSFTLTGSGTGSWTTVTGVRVYVVNGGSATLLQSFAGGATSYTVTNPASIPTSETRGIRVEVDIAGGTSGTTLILSFNALSFTPALIGAQLVGTPADSATLQVLDLTVGNGGGGGGCTATLGKGSGVRWMLAALVLLALCAIRVRRSVT